MPGPMGYTGDRLGLWEYQSETEATELLQQRLNRKKPEASREEEQRPAITNFARQATWGK